MFLYFSEMLGSNRRILLLKLPLQAVLVIFLVFSTYQSSAQDPFREFGLVKFGNAIEQKFHSGSGFREDSLGYLLFNSSDGMKRYNGQSFDNLEERPNHALLYIDE